MEIKAFLLIQSFTLLFVFSYGDAKLQATTCPKYECKSSTTSDNSVCSVYSTKEDTYTLEKCSGRTYCDFKENKDNSKCEKTKYDTLYTKPAYIGGSCSKSNDCINLNCVEGKCARLKETCDSTVECPFGQFCNAEKKCENGKGLGAKCDKDEQCKFNLGCLNGACTEPFSKENSFNMKEIGKENEPYYCKSGRIYNGLCNQVRVSSSDSCNPDEPCNYYLDKSETLISIEGTCKCTVSLNPTTKCMLGDIDLNDKWKEIVDIIKLTYSDDYIQKCNLAEPRWEFCREYMRNDMMVS